MEFISQSEKETKKLAKVLAKEIAKTKIAKKATVIGLEGELGAGKTVFVKGFAEGLGIKGKITSPTFVILKRFKIYDSRLRSSSANASASERSFGGQVRFKNLIHVDAYRLNSAKELAALGIKEIFSDPGNVVLIEWAERVQKILPVGYLKIHIDHLDKKIRRIIVTEQDQQNIHFGIKRIFQICPNHYQ